ncbi:MAG: RidA family protein, partial [Hyphomicrobiaceae bacterium]
LTAFGVDLLYEGLVLEIDGMAMLGNKRRIVTATSADWIGASGFPHAWQAGAEIYLGGHAAPGGAGLQAQTEASIERLRSTLEEAGGELGHLVKATIFYVDGRDDPTGARGQETVLRVLADYLPSPGPALTMVRVPGLPHEGQLMAIDGIARLDAIQD